MGQSAWSMGLKAEGGEHGAWSKNKEYNPFSIRYAICFLHFAQYLLL